MSQANRRLGKKNWEEERNQKCLPVTWIEGKKLRARSSLRIIVLMVGQGSSPSSPRSPKCEGNWRRTCHSPSVSSSTAPTNFFPSGHMIKGLKPQGIMTATFHTGYYIVLMTLDFSSSFKDKLFLSLKKNVSYSMMGSWELFSVHTYPSYTNRCLKFSRNLRANKVF